MMTYKKKIGKMGGVWIYDLGIGYQILVLDLDDFGSWDFGSSRGRHTVTGMDIS